MAEFLDPGSASCLVDVARLQSLVRCLAIVATVCTPDCTVTNLSHHPRLWPALWDGSGRQIQSGISPGTCALCCWANCLQPATCSKKADLLPCTSATRPSARRQLPALLQ